MNEEWMPEARQIAAQCWCDDETKNIEMDVVLAESIARRIAAWMSTSAQAYKDAEFYRNIIYQIGDMFGVESRTSDDGSVQQDILCLKVPELVARLKNDS